MIVNNVFFSRHICFIKNIVNMTKKNYTTYIGNTQISNCLRNSIFFSDYSVNYECSTNTNKNIYLYQQTYNSKNNKKYTMYILFYGRCSVETDERLCCVCIQSDFTLYCLVFRRHFKNKTTKRKCVNPNL